MRPTARAALLTLVGALAATQVAAGDRERLELLQADVDELQRQLYDMRRSLDQLTGDVRRVLELLESSGDRSALARFNANVQSLRSDIEGLGGRFDDTTDRLRRLEERVVAAPAATTASPSSSLASTPDQTATSLYNQAYADYIKDDFDLALDEFRDFVARYPQHEMAPNARYWAGMIEAERESWEEALAEFEAVLEQHPQASIVPDAMYRKAEALIALDRLGQAVLTLNELRTRHEGTAAARNAEQRLEEIARSGR